MSARAGHAAKMRCAFGFHPSLNVGARRGSSSGATERTATSQYGCSNVTEFSMGALPISLNENRKLEYPPTRNSPGARAMSPKVTLGPISSNCRTRSEHETGLWPPSLQSPAVGMSCAPQHMNTKSSGGAVSVAPVFSLVTTTLENSNPTVTPLSDTVFSPAPSNAESSLVTTSETYISLAAAGPPEVEESTAPTRTKSSEGRLVHVVTLNFRAPLARSGQFGGVDKSCCCNDRRGVCIW